MSYIEVTTAKGSKVEIQSVMCLSTGHLTEATAKILNADGKRPPWAPTIAFDYGWIWYADEGSFDSADFPPEFEAIFKLANALGCFWVKFDCDGPRIDELPFHEW